MTNMKRTTISIPDDLDKAIIDLRKKESFIRCSYSEIARYLLIIGLKAENKKSTYKKT